MSRDMSRGDTNDLILLSKELQRQLEDRRDANVKVSYVGLHFFLQAHLSLNPLGMQLTTENNRYKRQLYDLQQRLADIESGRPTKKGEASSMLALRMRVRIPVKPWPTLTLYMHA